MYAIIDAETHTVVATASQPVNSADLAWRGQYVVETDRASVGDVYRDGSFIAPEKPVPERKNALCDKIDLAADAARQRFVSPGDLIDKEYDLALQQSKDWITAEMPDPVPSAVLSGIAASGGQLTPEQAARQIIDMAAAWEEVLLQIRGIRLGGKAAVQQAADDADLDAIARVWLERLELVVP